MHFIDKSNREQSTAHEGKLRRFIFDEFQRSKMRNPSYSLRAFAKRLSLPVSALSEILQGKRSISLKSAEKVLQRLALGPNEHEDLLKPFLKANSSSEIAALRSPIAVQLEMDQYRVISDWFHFAILSLAETADFDSEIEVVARRLGITNKVAAEAVERLVRLGLINRSAGGELKPTGISYSTPDGIASLSLRRGHESNLELARQSLERDSIENRDFTAVTMAIDPLKLPEAKKRIRIFQNELCAFLESDLKTEVYKVCLQLFPLTTLTGDRK